jgi:hypothetical protein
MRTVPALVEPSASGRRIIPSAATAYNWKMRRPQGIPGAPTLAGWRRGGRCRVALDALARLARFL